VRVVKLRVRETMPPLPSPGDVLRIRFQYTLAADIDLLNTVHFAWSGVTPVGSTCTTLAHDAAVKWNSELMLTMNQDVNLKQTTVEDLSSSTGAVGVDNTASLNGAETGVSLSAGVAAVLSFKIGRRYRGGHPRIYLPGLDTSFLFNETQFTGSFIGAVEAEWAAFAAYMSGLTVAGTVVGAAVNVSYFQGFTSFQNPITHRWRNVPNVRVTPQVDTLTGYAVNPRPASQRRRNQQGT